MKHLILLLLVLFAAATPLFGQFYSNQFRPYGLNWQELKTDHFRIIYPVHHEAEAYRTARILELQYPYVQKLTGGNLHHFPFILNSENDLSNGFVTPLNFRSEIEIPPIKGKTMNPRSGDWLELVAPHELVHALHMNVNSPGLTSVFGLFSPDIRRSIHTAAPLGIFEGIAVEHESHGVLDQAGRGHHAYFTNRFNSNFISDNRWSMGQLVHVSSNTLPFDRHYVGGYEFTHWLINEFGDDVIKDAIEFHFRWPILGFGFALRRKTGEWPSSLYRNFADDIEQNESQRSRSLGTPTLEFSEKPLISKKGADIRRPLWLNDQTLLVFGRFYNAPTGFYIYDITTDKLDLLFEHRSVEDFRFSIDRSTNQLYFADYVTSGKYDNTYSANLFRYDLNTDTISQLTRNERVFAPAAGHTLMALQTDGSSNRLVAVDSDSGETEPLVHPGELETIEEIVHHPAGRNLSAIIARKGSVQALWTVSTDQINGFLDQDPDILFKGGSVYDLDWHPSEEKLLFTSDHTGTMNVYEYEISNSTVRQITNSWYNAFEASYSPNGSQIAYVYQDQSRNFPSILKQNHYYGRILSEDEWKPTPESIAAMDRNLLDTENKPDESGWYSSNYSTGLSWLKPRTFLPYYDEPASGIREAGIQFLSADPMNRNTYSLSLSTAQDRFWFDLDYQYSGFYPGFGLNVFERPSFALIRDSQRELETPVHLMLQNRGAGFHIPFRYSFRRNTRLTSISITPFFEAAQVRFFETGSTTSALNDFTTQHSAGLSAIFNYRLRQFRRDLQPNAGWIFLVQTELDLGALDFDFTVNEVNFTNQRVERRGLRLGLFKYLAPLSRWNQSLRLSGQILTQTQPGKYNAQSIVSNAFADDVFLGAHNLAFFGTRYTLPFIYPDDGGFLVPVYLSNLYLVLFSQSAANLNESGYSEVIMNSQTAFGAGIRSRFRLSNFTIDFGIGVGYEPSRDQWSFIIGQF